MTGLFEMMLLDENDALERRVKNLETDLHEARQQNARAHAERLMLTNDLSAQAIVVATLTDDLIKARNRIAELTLGT